MHPIAGSQKEGISISLRDLLAAMRSPLRHHLLQSRQTQIPQRTGLPALSLAWLPSIVAFKCQYASYCTVTYRKAMTMLNSWIIPSLDGLAVLCEMYPRVKFALLAARAHVGSYWACCQLEIPLCMAALQSLLSQVKLVSSVALFQLQHPAFVFVKCPATGDCPMLHLDPSARPLAPWESQLHLPVWHHQQSWGWHSHLLVRVLSRGGPRTWPWGATLVTGCQLDAPLLTTTLWALSFSCLFYQCTTNLLTPQLESLSKTVLWRTTSKALLKSRNTTLTFFPSFTGQATW